MSSVRRAAAGPRSAVHARPTPKDLLRWVFWGPFRSALSPTRPHQVRRIAELWRLHHLATSPAHDRMRGELVRTFGSRFTPHGYDQLVRDAYRAAFRAHLGELLLDRLDPGTVDHFIQVRGRPVLDTALARGKGVVWLYPHAGPVMLMLAALAHRGYRYTQVAARGLAPPEIAEMDPRHMGSNWFRESVRRVRESKEDRVPVRFLDQDAPVRELHRSLERNEIVGIAFDGRLGEGFVEETFLGRPALLSPGPFKLAVHTGATVVPAFCHSGKKHVSACEIGGAFEPGSDWRALMRRVLRTMEGWILRHPEEYGLWLLHCFDRRAAEHPLFLDYPRDPSAASSG